MSTQAQGRDKTTRRKSISFHTHTIFSMVGVSGCGKTLLAEQIRQHAIARGLTAVTISSDAIRRQLLDSVPSHSNADHRRSERGMETSALAFDLLWQLIEAHTTFPVSTNVIIIDTTGLDLEFQKRVTALARERHYISTAVVFDYGSEKSYLHEHSNKRVVERQVKRFKTQILPGLAGCMFKDRYDVRKQTQEHVFADLRDITSLKRTVLSPTGNTLVIGDIHEDVDQLKQLLEKAESEHQIDHIVFVGDLIDKGTGPTPIVRFVKDLAQRRDVRVVWGNHESYVFRRLTLDPDKFHPAPADVETTYFTSTAYYRDHPDEFEEFKELIDLCYVPYVEINRGFTERRAFVTHAPCKIVDIAKMSTAGQRNMRQFRCGDTNDEIRAALVDVFKEHQNCHPMHIVGHVRVGSPQWYKNAVMLDTGCGEPNGGFLSALYIPIKGKPTFISNGESYEAGFTFGDMRVLTFAPHQERHIQKHMKTNMSFIANTIPPAPADYTINDIESLRRGVQYFIDRGINLVHVEPKHMGSRAQIYLTKDINTCQVFSRGGHKIPLLHDLRKQPTTDVLDDLSDLQRRAVVLTPLVEQMMVKYADQYEQLMIVDAELLPWTLFGQKWIDSAFNTYHHTLNVLATEFLDDPALKSLDIKQHLDVDIVLTGADIMNHQIQLYTNPNIQPHFQPFSVLYRDGVVLMKEPQSVRYNSVNTDMPGLLVDLTDASAFDQIFEFYQQHVDADFEGIVIKPEVWNDGVLPAMKVRNPNYLTIVYGADYECRLQSLIKNKWIDPKARISMKEAGINFQLLSLLQPDGSISDSGKRENLIRAMVGELEREQTLDPRL